MSEALTDRIASFFRRNPHEWLTFEDMGVKFDCTPQQAQKACEHLTTRYGLKRESQLLVRMLEPAEAKR